ASSQGEVAPVQAKAVLRRAEAAEAERVVGVGLDDAAIAKERLSLAATGTAACRLRCRGPVLSEHMRVEGTSGLLVEATIDSDDDRFGHTLSLRCAGSSHLSAFSQRPVLE